MIRNDVCRVVDLLKHSSAVSLSRVMPPETWKYTFNFQVQVVEIKIFDNLISKPPPRIAGISPPTSSVSSRTQPAPDLQ